MNNVPPTTRRESFADDLTGASLSRSMEFSAIMTIIPLPTSEQSGYCPRVEGSVIEGDFARDAAVHSERAAIIERPGELTACTAQRSGYGLG